MSAEPGRRGLLLPLAAAALCALLFAALGVWQLQRMAWKHDLVARVEARAHAAPAAPPPPAEWSAAAADPQLYEYRRVHLRGAFLHDRQTLVQASTALGAGFWVMTPLRMADGSHVLVNRGFVPDRHTPVQRPAGEVALDGLVRLSEPGGGFLRDNDPAADRWHGRDVAAIAAARGLPASAVAPYFVDADAALPAGQWPAGGLTVLRFPDNHLPYAVTWFILSAMAVGAGVLIVRPRRKPADA